MTGGGGGLWGYARVSIIRILTLVEWDVELKNRPIAGVGMVTTKKKRWRREREKS